MDYGYNIEENVGVISEDPTGWKLELNKISWRGQPAKYDIRRWSEDHSTMSKGIVLSDDEAESLHEILSDEFGVKINLKISAPKSIYLKNKNQLVKLLKKYASSKREYFLLIGIGEFREDCFEVVFIKDLSEKYSASGATFSLRQVFKELFLEDCTCFFVAHNHPICEILSPSAEDLSATNSLTALGNQFECPLIDHLIFNEKLKYYSLAENELLNISDEDADLVSDDMYCRVIANWACDKVKKERRRKNV